MVPEFIQSAVLVMPDDLEMAPLERTVLSQLAHQVAALAARPGEEEKRQLWRRHNRLEPTRPVVFCDPENAWHEIIPSAALTCVHKVAREWEFHLRREIFWGEQMGDDRPIEPFFNVAVPFQKPFWGLREIRIGGLDGGAYIWDSPVKNENDIERLHYPTITADFATADQLEALAVDVLGTALTVRRRTSWWWTTGMTSILADLRGLEQMMFDMSDRPQFLHRMMAFLRDGTLALVEGLAEAGLLSPNWDGAYVGSGALGYSDELPQPDFEGKVRLKDSWVLGESQETVGISPRMFAEFIWPYQRPILERFGLVCYGCCEPLDSRWKIIRELLNLRRVSVSPWSDRAKMAAELGDQYIYSLKPNPADLAMETMDLERLRTALHHDLEVARGCRIELVMKDNHTLRGEGQRAVDWVRMAREEADHF